MFCLFTLITDLSYVSEVLEVNSYEKWGKIVTKRCNNEKEFPFITVSTPNKEPKHPSPHDFNCMSLSVFRIHMYVQLLKTIYIVSYKDSGVF